MTFVGSALKVGRQIKKDILLYQGKLKKASKNAAVGAAAGLKNDLRAQVKTAGLGQKVANAWRSAAFPQRGDSLNSAAVVWTNAPHIISAFDKGSVVRAKNKKYIAIPTQNCPKGTYKGKRITPSNWPEGQYGELVFVGGRSDAAFLGVRNLRKHYNLSKGKYVGLRKANKAWMRMKQPVEPFVVMFILKTQAQMKKTLDVKAMAAKWHAEFPRLIDSGMK